MHSPGRPTRFSIYITHVCACAEPACRCTIRDGWTWAWSFCHGVMSQAVSGRTDRLWRVCSVGASVPRLPSAQSQRESAGSQLSHACILPMFMHAHACMHQREQGASPAISPAVSILPSLSCFLSGFLSTGTFPSEGAGGPRPDGAGCRVQGAGCRGVAFAPDAATAQGCHALVGRRRLASRRMSSLHTTLSSHASPPAG